MTVQTIDTLDPARFTAVILTEDTLEATRGLLPQSAADNLGLTAEEINEERTAYYHTSSEKFSFFGTKNDLKTERVRRLLHTIIQHANSRRVDTLQLVLQVPDGLDHAAELAQALGEIPVLSNYQFLPYKTREEDQKKKNPLRAVHILTNLPDAQPQITTGTRAAEATCVARDLVNEPPNVLTSVELAQRAVSLGKQYGFSVEVLDKAQIEEKKMGGLLAVNRGSMVPPTFSILEWKPAQARNEQPVVLVGKGIVFDTGGLSLKPTAGSMDSMKSDMGGAAAVIGAFVALAANEVPCHVVGLIPSTDNRPGQDAYTPNDVITMYDGTTVEVLNTDAEGRMILADALTYAKSYNPAFVVDLATLTGSAVIAVGHIATPVYSTADEGLTRQLIESGNRTYERLVHFPLWDEYMDLLKSDIADMKNVGSRAAGSITAAKFLQHFTDYPWFHLDIAGTAYLDAADSYRGKNGTGAGVRLLHEFLRTYVA